MRQPASEARRAEGAKVGSRTCSGDNRPGLIFGALLCSACSSAISDDPADWDVEPGAYTLSASEPRYVIPSNGLPADVTVQASNNNLDLITHDGRMYFAWRTGEVHFATTTAMMYVVASEDDGVTWTREHTISLGKDVREPRFLSIDGRLFLFYFDAGTNFFEFRPNRIWRVERNDDGTWTAPEVFGDAGEVLWDLKVRDGRAYMTSYLGTHYMTGPAKIDVRFRVSEDGVTWANVGKPAVYTGGVSETAFETDEDGGLWIITRNEDGDESGFGSHLCTAPASDWSAWSCPEKSSPYRYDSPEMFRHGSEIYLVARRDPNGPFAREMAEGDDPDLFRINLQSEYWNRSKRTALYHINREQKIVEHMFDLPSAGDTAYPAVIRRSAHEFLLANYTSPVSMPDISWATGQTSTFGTWIYFTTLTFTPGAK